MSKGRRRWMTRFQLSKESKFTLPLQFCSIQDLDGLGDACSQWNEWIFIQPADSNVKVFQRHPEITFYQLSGHPLAPSSCHIILTIMYTQFDIYLMHFYSTILSSLSLNLLLGFSLCRNDVVPIIVNSQQALLLRDFIWSAN